MSSQELSPGPSGGLPFRAAIGPLAILTGVFLANFTSRMLLAPLLPTIEADLGLDHSQAGSLFLYTSLGYFVSLLGSGFVAARLNNRRTILLSALLLSLAQFGLALADSTAALVSAQVGVGLACGLYLPCAMAAIYGLVRPHDWGKAVAVHELAPNLAFLLVPAACALLLMTFSWQQVTGLFATLTLATGILFAWKGRGGESLGRPPTPASLKILLGHSSFWIMTLVFSFAIGSSVGVYTMLPLYLVAGRGLDPAWANTLVSLSRILSVGSGFAAGYLTDRLGVGRAMRIYLLASGSCTLCLGLVPGGFLEVFLFLQPLITVCIFPAGFAALARVGPVETRNLAISFVIPPAFLIGTGVLPTFIGAMGDLGRFGWGISLVGVLVLFTVPVLSKLKFDEKGPS